MSGGAADGAAVRAGAARTRLGGIASSRARLRLEPSELLAAARAGDEDAFRRLTGPHARELHLHCYRMLGSLHDAEDLLQETLVLAWRRLETLAGASSLRAWLYRIATNACLNELSRSPERRLPRAYGPPASARGEHVPHADEILHLEPYPDVLLDRLAAESDPEAAYLRRESVELAFLAAVQLLPPRQRAVLILHDVLGWTAREVGELIDASAAAVNSALQRARARLAAPRPGAAALPAASDEDARLLGRYVRAWEEADMGALADLLREDAVLTMPPSPSWYAGRASIVEFLSTSEYVFGAPGRRLRLVPTRANRQPAFAAYARDGDSGAYEAYGIMVLRLEEGLVAEITGFADADLFRFFDLPRALHPGEAGG